MSTQSKDKNFW